MSNVLDSHLLNDVVSRVEQSRSECTSQTAELRQLNTNFETYLITIKQIDDENGQLQDSVEQIRSTYIRTLENHLKRLPEDFRQESRVLTEAHIERYKSKSRAKRFANERDEMKKRINFVGNHGKEQNKRLNQLRRQERAVLNELKKLQDQYRNVTNQLEREKQLYRQAMEKVDQLQVQLEEVSVERSKTEFEVQSLREEVMLMQTAKEFLDEECEAILGTQAEANDYFLSCLNESIVRIQDDFDELNTRQLKQVESDYEQMIKVAEEQTLAKVATVQETSDRQGAAQVECDKLRNENHSATHELSALHDTNRTLTERVLAMEADLYALRADRLREAVKKDNELQQSKMELESLNEQLAHFTEYDRNLKFELTLYRGVLESEYRRKQQQQQQQQSNGTGTPARPTLLRTAVRQSSRTFPVTMSPLKEGPSHPKSPEIDNDKEESQPPQSPSPTSAIDDGEKAQEQRNEDRSSQLLDGRTLLETITYLTSSLFDNEKEAGSNDTDMQLQDQPTSDDSEKSSLVAAETQEVSNTSQEVHRSPISSQDGTSASFSDETPSPQSVISSFPIAQLEETALAASTSTPPSTPIVAETSTPSPMAPSMPDDSSAADEQPISTSTDDVDEEVDHAKLSDGYDNDFEVDDSSKSSVFQPLQPSSEQESDQIEKEESSSSTPSATPLHPDESVPEPDLPEAEEQPSSSAQPQPEEDSEIGYTSSSGYYGPSASYNLTLNQQSDEPASSQASLTDVADDNSEALGEVDQSTSLKLGEKLSGDDSEASLEAVMQDLRYVYRDLANDEEVVNIDEDFPDFLTDRLEFGDTLIRTLFDNFITQYLVQPAVSGARSKALDWVEFRDILFPILTGRYMERHIRKLFNLFDTSKDEYLSFQEIVELFELLQVSNSNELAQYVMHEFDQNKDGKLSVDEFISVVRKTDDVNNNMLPEYLEERAWFTQHPFDDGTHEDESISFEVPVIGFAAKPNANSVERILSQMTLLGRIFKRVGADVDNKQLDSNQSTLAMKLTNEFINNNICISNEDLHSFIESYLNKKRHSDRFIKWEEFRDVFLPLVHDGLLTKDEMSQWFDVLDTEQRRAINQDQTLHLLRLLQFAHPEKILEKMYAISELSTNHNDAWTLEELLFAFDNTDETTTRLYMDNEHMKSFDRQWLCSHVF